MSGDNGDPAAVLYVKLYTMVLDDPKKMGLSFRAFGLWAVMMAMAKRAVTDGFVSTAHLDRESFGRDDPWQEPMAELEASGAVEPVYEGWVLSAWLNHNKSVDAISSLRRSRTDRSLRANHQRWHVNEGRPSADCSLCVESGLVTPTKDSARLQAGVLSLLHQDPSEGEREGEREGESEVKSGSAKTSTATARPAAEIVGGEAEAEITTMDKLLAVAGIVKPRATTGQVQTAARALARGWTYDQLAEIATQARDEGNPRAYLNVAIENRSNRQPSSTPVVAGPKPPETMSPAVESDQDALDAEVAERWEVEL